MAAKRKPEHTCDLCRTLGDVGRVLFETDLRKGRKQ